jgi:hypothetical protein
MGICGLHFRVNLRRRRALPGGAESRGNSSAGVGGAALCFLCDASGKPDLEDGLRFVILNGRACAFERDRTMRFMLQ